MQASGIWDMSKRMYFVRKLSLLSKQRSKTANEYSDWGISQG